MGDLKEALWGTEYKKKQSKDLITDVPDGFKEWVAENMDAQANWSSTPYFIRDNFVNGDLSKGLKIDLPTVEPDAPNIVKFDYDTPNDALDAYVGGDMMWINQYLRGRGDFGELTAKEKQFIEDLTQVTQSDIVGERTLWRSVDARAIFGEMSAMTFESLEDYFIYGDTSEPTKRKIQRLLNIVGKEFVEKGFMSTTKDHDIAADWGDYTGSDFPILLKIHTTANTRGVDVERYTKIHNPEAEEDNPQAEMLLSCNQKFKVVSVSKDSGNICVEVELIDKAQPAQATPKVDPVQAQRDLIAKAQQSINQTQILLDKSKAMNKPIANPLSDEAKKRRSQIKEEAKKTLSGTTMSNPDFSKPINISNYAIKEWLNQPFFNPEAKNESLLYLPTLMQNADYKGPGKDKHDPNVIVHVFEIKISGRPCWVLVREFHNGMCNLHSLTDNISILDVLDKKKP
ncbi:MAG: hypothetical protein K2K27_09790 [Muribaculaceae bacterium]|nr:hypothetical protein [Muribaculaceae bacterium]